MKTLPAIALTGALAFAAGLAVAGFVLPHMNLSGTAGLAGGPSAIGASEAANGGSSGHSLPFGPGHLPGDAKGIADALAGLNLDDDDFEVGGQMYELIRQTTPGNIRGVIQGYLERRGNGYNTFYVAAELFHRWAKLDPKAAIAGLDMLNSREKKEEATEEILSGWASVDFDAANRWVEALPPGHARISAEAALLQSLAKTDPQRALELAREDSRAGAEAEAIGQIFRVLAGQDPQAAAEEAASLPPGRSRTAALAGVVREWAQSDPAAAVDLIETRLHGDAGRGLLSNTLENWQRRDFDATFAWLQKRPADAERGRLAEELIDDMASEEDPAKALQLIDLVPLKNQDGMLRNIASEWARQSPADAEAWAKSQTDPTVAKAVWPGIVSGLMEYPQQAAALALQLPKDQQPEAVNQVAESWAQRDPQSAAAWTSGLADPAQQLAANRSIMRTWIESDPTSALQWFSKMPGGFARDDILSSVAGTLTRSDPNTALQWVGTIQDPKTREEATINSLNVWMDSDRDAATAWIASSSLADDVKKRVLQR